MSTTAEKIAVMQAWIDGKTIRFRRHHNTRGSWEHFIREEGEPLWNWDTYVYEVMPTKPSIDWSHVVPEFKWLARDKDGSSWFYREKPILHANEWRRYEYDPVPYRNARMFASYKPGDCDWRESLISREDAS